jgi:uncharacterized membrane protein
MEERFKQLASVVALSVESAAVLLIAIGAVEAMALTLSRLTQRTHSGTRKIVHRKEIWIRFAMWLLLGLEFELAADVVRTAIAPTWSEIGQLGAIAAIRTALNFFLEKDISEYEGRAAAV